MAMSQRLTSTRFPYLPLEIHFQSFSEQVEALLDTGFDGNIALPSSSITSGIRPDGYLLWTLADGSEVIASAYDATARVDTLSPFPVTVIALGEEPLVGRGVSDRFTITLDHGRQLTVEP